MLKYTQRTIRREQYLTRFLQKQKKKSYKIQSIESISKREKHFGKETKNDFISKQLQFCLKIQTN